MNSTELAAKFNVGDIVVYPSQGVGKIMCLEIRGEKEYLRIKLPSTEMDILLPKETAASFGLRALASECMVRRALLSLSEKPMLSSADWKIRLLENQALLKKGDLISVAKIINNLYRRSKRRELPALERRLYDTAISMLVDESSYVLGIDKEEIRKEIFLKLED